MKVNGVTIPHDIISREAQNHPAPTPIRAWTAAARALVVRELLLQEARRLDLQPDPISDEDGRRETQDEALVRLLIEARVTMPSPDEASCRRYYQQNLGRFRSADIYEASHILIAARSDQREPFVAARKRAEELRSRVANDPALFEELAVADSDCPSGASGGNLGQLTSGATTPEFEKALLTLRPGETSQAPIETRYGFHIIRLDRHLPGRELPFEAVHARIADYVAERAQRIAIAQFVARLASQAELSGIDLPTAADLRIYCGYARCTSAPSSLVSRTKPVSRRYSPRSMIWYLLARVRRAAAAAGEPLGSFASAAVGEFIEHADDEAWQSPITAASKAADPATACLKRMLAFAIPVEDPAAGPAAPRITSEDRRVENRA